MGACVLMVGRCIPFFHVRVIVNTKQGKRLGNETDFGNEADLGMRLTEGGHFTSGLCGREGMSFLDNLLKRSIAFICQAC